MGTYRNELQTMITQLQAIYDKANYLRDQSDQNGQHALNQFRSLLPLTWDVLQNLDNNLNDAIANQDV